MTALVSVYGRLGQDPRRFQTASDKAMAGGSLAVSLPVGKKDADDQTEWFKLLAFGHQAEALLRHEKGDLLSVSGRLQISTWTDNEGAQRRDLQVIVDSIVSAKAVRPVGRLKGKDTAGWKPRQSRPEPVAAGDDGPAFNDEIPY